MTSRPLYWWEEAGFQLQRQPEEGLRTLAEEVGTLVVVEGIHVAEVGILVEAVVHILVEWGTPVEVDIQAQAVRTLL